MGDNQYTALKKQVQILRDIQRADASEIIIAKGERDRLSAELAEANRVADALLDKLTRIRHVLDFMAEVSPLGKSRRELQVAASMATVSRVE